MAGDWIKMRSDLFTHPKVVRISSALKADTLRTVGGLMSVWCLFDVHSIDGKLEGYTQETLDDHLRWAGFAEQMVVVKWLLVGENNLELPEFDTHNGESAKRRAQDADRKRAVRKTSALEPDKKRTREEKRREDIEVDKSTSVRPSKKCPSSFVVTDEMLIAMQGECPLVEIAAQTVIFRDHTFKAAKTDWIATWRNWMRTKQERLQESAPAKTGTAPQSFKQADDLAARARWEEMTGRQHPDNMTAPKHGGMVFDVTPKTLEISQ